MQVDWEHATRSDEIWTPKDVAEYFHVSQAWVRDHATRKQPRLKCIKLGAKLLRFFRKDIEEFARKWLQC